jgi:tetratricopeptide (TPR) repeat protein
MLSNLAAVLQRVFEWTGDTSALEEATDAIRRAAGMTGSDDAARAVFLGNLAASLQTLAERTGGSQVLADALEASRAALVAAPADHPYRSRYLSNLGRVLQVMSEQTGDAALLAEAVDARRRAVESTPAGHIERAAFLTDLANTLRAQFGQTGNTSLLQEAVEVSRQAVDVTPEDYADRASRLVNLATTLRMLAEQTADSAFVEEAGQLYDEAARLPTAAAHVRLSAGYWAAATDLDLGDAEAALRTAEDMAALLPQAAERGLSRDDREYRLGTAAGLPVLAAAASVAAGQYGRGVELLEQTRGILLTEGMEDRMDAAVLRRVAPDLAFEYDALRREFASLERASEEGVIPIPTISATDTSSIIRIARTGALAEARRDLAMRWDDLLIRIRHQPGLQDFLRPPPVGELRPNAADGPIVLIYTSRWNSGALILTTDGPDPAQYVPLPAMTEDNTYAQINRLLQARRTEADTSTPAAQRIEAQDDIHQVLAWMWDAITAPILSALGLEDTPEPGQPWPRIWWCPVGGLAFLPLHAAGYHLDRRLPGQTARTVMDRAVSSYTTTARTMSYTRSRQQGNPARLSPSMLIVAVPDLPGAPPLPGVSHEADLLQQLIPDTQRLDGPAATHDAVVTALDSHQIAHFACHGISDWQHTAGSRLLLHDDAEQPLTAAVISRQRLTDAGLAYLSACSTAMPRPATTDEPAHIAAAFQLAGYPQIIATLWPVSDTAAVRIASEFYTYLTGSGRQPTDLRGSAAALHHAVRFLRDKYPNLPSAWAAYIHLGT